MQKNNKKMSKYQAVLISREQARYRTRLKQARKDNPKFKRPVVISTRTIHEPPFKEQYRNFISSPFWRHQREKIMRRNTSCNICGCKDNLEVNHISYENVFSRTIVDHLNDFVVVCRTHHQMFHDKYGVKKVMKEEWAEFEMKNKK